MKNTILVVVSLLWLSACSSGSDGDIRIMPVEGRTAAEKSLREAHLECENPNDCPGFAGGLVTVNASFTSYGVCSDTLIYPDRILTNSHCVPFDLAYDGMPCSGRIFMHFPKTEKYPKEVFECEKIEKISFPQPTDESGAARPDYAIIKFKGLSARERVKLNTNGVPENSSIHLYKIDYTLSKYAPPYGVVRKTTCVANSNHFFSRDSIGPLSALMNTSHCNNKLKKGNSGSGYLNDQQELIALHSFSTKVKQASKEERRKLEKDNSYAGGGTNLACIHGLTGYTPPNTCEFIDNEYRVFSTLFDIIQSMRIKMIEPDEDLMLGLKNSDVDIVKTSDDTTYLDRLKLTGPIRPSMSPLTMIILKEYVESDLLTYPKCVVSEEKDKISVELATRACEKCKSKINDQMQVEYDTSIKIEEFGINKDEQGLYQMQIPIEINGDEGLAILGLSGGKTVLQLQVPVCGEELVSLSE